MEKKLNSNHLKFIAIFAMTVDHVADLLFPNFQLQPIGIFLHIIGRLTAPIMWFFICEGYYYTKNLKKYLFRMFLFALISHFAYCFAFGINYLPFSRGQFFNQTSVIWTLAWGLVALWIFCGCEHLRKCHKILLLLLINAITFPSDWSCIAVMAIISMYKNRGNVKKQTASMMLWVVVYAVISFFFVDKVYGILQLFVILVYPLLQQYNGQRGKAKWTKWLFYIYYPAHLVIIGIIRLVLYGDVPLLF